MKEETKKNLEKILLFIAILIVGMVLGGMIVDWTDWNARDAAIKVFDIEIGEPVLDGEMAPGSVFQYKDIRIYIFDPGGK